MNRIERDEHLQQRIDAISAERNALRDKIERAKKGLVHLADHWDERSSNARRMEIISIAEEVL